MRSSAVALACVLALPLGCARSPAPPARPLPAPESDAPLDEDGWQNARDRAVRAWEAGSFDGTTLAIVHDERAAGTYLGVVSRVRASIDGDAEVDLDDAKGWMLVRAIAPGLHTITVRTRLSQWCVYCAGLSYEVKRSFTVRIGSGTATVVRVAVRRHGGITAPLEEALRLDVEARAWFRISSAEPAVVEGMRAIDAAIDRVTVLVDDARRARDIILLTCTLDKRKQLDAMRLVALERAASLASATATNDLERATHERTVLRVLHARADVLATEADQCI